MSYAQWCNRFLFVFFGIILILVLGFYSGLSGRVRTVYLFSLCVVSLLPSRFTASALVWFYNFLKYLVFHFFISLSTVLICRSSWILWLFMYQERVTIDGIFIGNLYTRLGITNNYSATTKLQNSQITTAHAKPFSRLLCLHQPFPGNGF
jgi:hypothetical protein